MRFLAIRKLTALCAILNQMAQGGIMFNKQGLSGLTAFKKRIAPKIAARIQGSIDVQVAGEDTCLNAWLIENLKTISPLHITLAATQAERPGKSHRREAKYE